MTESVLRELRNEMREMRAEMKAEIGLVYEGVNRIERRLASLEGMTLTHSTRLDELEAQGEDRDRRKHRA